MFYIGARSRPPNPTTLRRNQKLGKPTRPHPRTQRPSPSQRAAHTPPYGTSERGTSAYGGPPSPHPTGSRVPFPDHPGDGGSIDSTRHAPFRGPLPNRCPLSGERLCVGIYFAGEAKRPGVTGIRASEPLRGSTVVTIGELLSAHDDFESNAVPHSGRALMRDGLPHPGTPSTPASPQRHAWGYGRTAADVIDPLWWTTSVGVGAIVILHQSLGPSIADPPPTRQTENPKPHNRRWNIRLGWIRLWRTEEKAGVSLTYRTSTCF